VARTVAAVPVVGLAVEGAVVAATVEGTVDGVVGGVLPALAEPAELQLEAVRAAGKAPLHAVDPGYRSGLDGDHDGTACE
jgi:hypothetical protein